MTRRFDRSAAERVDILGCRIDPVDMESAVSRCETFVRERAHAQHMAVNAAKIVSSRRHRDLQRLINQSDIVTADGQAVVWAARMLGAPLPSRVTGIDLMQRLFALAERRGYRVFLLGARTDVLETAIGRLRVRHPHLTVAGWRDGYFSSEDEPGVAAQIRAARPDLLFVAMPTPRKEYFLGRWGSELGVPFSMGVGGALDVIAGETRRAPRALQRVGLEWAFRVAQEPRRLWRRYLITNAAFVCLTVRAIVTRLRPIDRPPL